ncbi:MAG: AI-2E family transporter [Armatimonadota bacterium]|nr:AI-2E family transporter [Armatimonadota bacterium]
MIENDGDSMFSIARYRKVGFGIACVLLAVIAFIMIVPFWQAIAWGVALSIIVHPLFTWLNKRMSDTLAALVTTFATLIFLVLPLIVMGLALYGEANHLRTELELQKSETGQTFSLSVLIEETNNQIQPYLTSMGIKDVDLREIVAKIPSALLGSAPQIATAFIKGIITFVFALLLLFFILRDGKRLYAPSLDLLPLPRKKSGEIYDIVYDTVTATFVGIVLVAILQGTILGITFWALGLPAPLLWGSVAILLCMIPFAGAPIIWVPTCVILASQGHWAQATILAVVGAGVVGLVDNIFKPVIIGMRVKLHPMAVALAIFGGIATMGPVGILVGPVVLSVHLGAVQVIREINELHVDDGGDNEGPAIDSAT